MDAARHVVLALFRPQSEWFRELARWTTASTLPAEVVKCLSADEVRAHLASARPFSAVLVDGGLPAVDRDLVDRAREAGCVVLVVDDPHVRRDWAALGVAAELPAAPTRADLLAALDGHAARVRRPDVALVARPAGEPDGWRGALVAVTGAAGAGSSTVAMALAQGLGADPANAGLIVLADLALDADQAVLHDAGDVVPSLTELVDAHRTGSLAPDDVRASTFRVPDRGYSLLLGLRRHRDWVALRPRAVAATVDALRRSFVAVVADVDDDLEGVAECGSTDVEERNVLARTATAEADLVVACGLPGPKGVHALVRTLLRLLDHGVPPDRIVPVVNRAPRRPRHRAEVARALADLVTGARRHVALPTPVHVGEVRHLDELVRDARGLPAAVVEPLTAAVAPLLGSFAPRRRVEPEPVPVTPGSLGRWSEG